MLCAPRTRARAFPRRRMRPPCGNRGEFSTSICRRPGIRTISVRTRIQHHEALVRRKLHSV